MTRHQILSWSLLALLAAVQPALAESWETPDQQTYIFHLRQSVKFHSGKEFDSQDVVYSLNSQKTPPTPGTVISEVCAHEDMMPTILAAAGDPNIVEECLKGHQVGDKTFKVHLDGYNLLPALKGDTRNWPRKEMVYWSDDGDLMALRHDRWKVIFQEQRAEGMKVWSDPFVKLRWPTLIDLRADPFEKAPQGSIYYNDWAAHRMFVLVPAQAFVGEFLQTFRDFPQRQKADSFNLDEVLRKMQEAHHT